MGKSKSAEISLDSFLDILTCLQGVLMLIIITTGIDAAQTKVIMATPIELVGNERPIYIEARSEQLFIVPVDEARKAIREKQEEIVRKRREQQTTVDIMEAIGSADVSIGSYTVDFARFLAGQIALIPNEDVIGYSFEDHNKEMENPTNWFGSIINNIDVDNERINFLVRDDSYKIFKLARLAAWSKSIKVTYSLIPRNDALTFQ
ncbi:MAG: hypothetical protein ACO3ZG_03595 [Kiritimatiellia bacterium]